MLHAEANGRSVTVNMKGDQLLLDGDAMLWDIVQLPDGRLHIIKGVDGYLAEVISHDPSSGTFRIRINGREVVVNLQTPLGKRLAQMGMDQRPATTARYITAPMPGLITSVRVAIGDTIAAGTPLLVLEAMKMENVLQSPGDGTIVQVRVAPGDRVEKGQVLVEF